MLTSDVAARLLIKDSATAALLRVYAMSVLVTIPVGTSLALLRVGNRFKWIAYQDALIAVIRMVGIVIVLVLGGGVGVILMVYLGAAVMGMIIILTLSHQVNAQLKLGSWWRSNLGVLKGEYKKIFPIFDCD